MIFRLLCVEALEEKLKQSQSWCTKGYSKNSSDFPDQTNQVIANIGMVVYNIRIFQYYVNQFFVFLPGFLNLEFCCKSNIITCFQCWAIALFACYKIKGFQCNIMVTIGCFSCCEILQMRPTVKNWYGTMKFLNTNLLSSILKQVINSCFPQGAFLVDSFLITFFLNSTLWTLWTPSKNKSIYSNPL